MSMNFVLLSSLLFLLGVNGQAVYTQVLGSTGLQGRCLDQHGQEYSFGRLNGVADVATCQTSCLALETFPSTFVGISYQNTLNECYCLFNRRSDFESTVTNSYAFAGDFGNACGPVAQVREGTTEFDCYSWSGTRYLCQLVQYYSVGSGFCADQSGNYYSFGKLTVGTIADEDTCFRTCVGRDTYPSTFVGISFGDNVSSQKECFCHFNRNSNFMQAGFSYETNDTLQQGCGPPNTAIGNSAMTCYRWIVYNYLCPTSSPSTSPSAFPSSSPSASPSSSPTSAQPPAPVSPPTRRVPNAYRLPGGWDINKVKPTGSPITQQTILPTAAGVTAPAIGASCSDSPGWTDSKGYGCQAYADTEASGVPVCDHHKGLQGAGGLTPAQACCVCNYVACSDSSGWTDPNGYNCAAYAETEASGVPICDYHKDILGAGGLTCVQACCACQ